MKESGGKQKLYYSVLTACLMLIIGVSAVIYNSSLPKSARPVTTTRAAAAVTTRTQEHAANVTATGVPRPTATTRLITTVPAAEKPYTGDFAAPTDGKVTAEYSAGTLVKSQTMGDWRTHNGADFGVENSNDVYAVQNGAVSAVDKDELWGVCVTIRCAEGLEVRYCGLAEDASLKTGTAVRKGEVLGKVGALPIESADGTHVHIETTIDGKPVNPLEALHLL